MFLTHWVMFSITAFRDSFLNVLEAMFLTIDDAPKRENQLIRREIKLRKCVLTFNEIFEGSKKKKKKKKINKTMISIDFSFRRFHSKDKRRKNHFVNRFLLNERH